MDLSDFRAGSFRKQYQYRSFIPAFINHEWTWQDEVKDDLLKNADEKLTRLNGTLNTVAVNDHYQDMITLKESFASCKLERAEINFEEILKNESEVKPDFYDEWNDVYNVYSATKQALAALKRLPLSTRIFNQAHEILMDSEKGIKKTPGEFRKSQNWVGGKSLKDAQYISPPFEELPALMSDLENFIHNDELKLHHLIKLAIVHYQFIMLQPYLDDNGKLARMFIPLYMSEFGLLDKPVLNWSEQLLKSKMEYLVKINVAREKMIWRCGLSFL